MDSLASIRKWVPKELRKQPWAGLPRVHVIRSKGRTYLYFNAARDGEARNFVPLPDPASREFEPAYLAMYRAAADGRDAALEGHRAAAWNIAARSVVYFVGAQDGPVKIGFARDLPKRLATMQTGNHRKLIALATTPGSSKTEREYHRRFAAHRLHGEWFTRCPEIEAEITRLTNGSEVSHYG